MKYRLYQNDDFEQVSGLCRKNGIALPNGSQLIVAEDNGKIVGVCGIKPIWFIEPLISENSVVANNLFYQAIGHLKFNDIKTIRCVTVKENEKLFTKVGFEKIDKILMEYNNG